MSQIKHCEYCGYNGIISNGRCPSCKKTFNNNEKPASSVVFEE